MPQIALARDGSDGDIVTSDTVANVYDALYIGNGGVLKVTLKSGKVQTYQNIGDGEYQPLSVKLVWSSTTTCTNIQGILLN